MKRKVGMRMKNLAKSAVVAMATMCGYIAFAVTWPVAATDEAVKGEWMRNFVDATNLAQRTKSPMIMVWANQGCSHCEDLEAQLNATKFKTWQAEHGDYVYCFAMGSGSGGNDVAPNIGSGAKKFAQTAGGTLAKPLTQYPFVCLYWPKGNGDDVITSWSSASAEKIIERSAKLFADYRPCSVRFDCDGSNAWDRYEAEPGYTSYVDIRIIQDGGDTEAYRLIYRYPGGSAATEIPFSLRTDELAKTVRIPIPSNATIADVGRSILLEIVDSSGVVVSGSSITYVNPENAANNPLWKTERTVDTLDYGEWTADIDIATQKVARAGGEAWAMVELAGSLWCPDCYRTDVNFLEDGEKVKEWARSRKVVLVSVDTPHNSKTDPNPANPVGTIWSRDTDATKLIIPPFENSDPDKVMRSGKGYLSRKMISDVDALAMARKNLWLSKDYFHRPEDYATHRTLIPMFVLLDKGGNVVGRFETFDARSQSPTNRLHTMQYLDRFDEMIEMAKESSDASGEVTDNHWSTTTKTLAVGGSVSNKLSHADFQDVFCLSGIRAGEVRLSLGGTSTARMSIQLIEVKGDSTNVVAERYGKLSGGVDLAAEVDGSGEYYARIFCNKGGDGEPTDEEFASISTSSTVVAYLLTADFVLKPGLVAFDADSATFLEHAGEGVLSVSRKNGGSGAVSVVVTVVAEDANAVGRYRLDNPVLAWGDGEQGAKTVVVRLLENGRYDGRAQIKLKLVAAADCQADVSSALATVNIEDSDEPTMACDSYVVNCYLQFAEAQAFDVYNVQDPAKVELTLSKGSDRLPTGMKLEYDRATGQVLLTGTPKKAGNFVISFALTERRADGKITGPEAQVLLTIVDPQNQNPYLNQKRAKRTYALFAQDGDESIVAGTLDLSIAGKNKITAKYQGLDGKSVLFSGSWSDIDEESGSATAILSKGGVQLELTLAKDGDIQAKVVETGMTLVADCPVAEDADFSGYRGYYTVALPSRDGSYGCGYLTLDMTRSTFTRSGKVKFSGLSPVGGTLSGYAYLELVGDNIARLVVCKRMSSTGAVAAVLEIKSGGEANWSNPSDILAREVVNAAEGTLSYWIIGGKKYFCEVAGSWYNTSITAEKLVSAFYVNPKTEFNLVVADNVAGTLVANGKKFDYVPAVAGTKFSFNHKTGVFSGKTKKGKFKGVIVPGWYENCDCGEGVPEFPFGSGTLWRKEKSGGKSITVSEQISIDEAGL